MNRIFYSLLIAIFIPGYLLGQVDPSAGNWKTWFISSGKDYRLPAPGSYQDEIAQVLSIQQKTDETVRRQILYWNAGPPGYRWQEMMTRLWTVDTGRYGALANMLLGTAIYDATVVAWDSKYAHRRPRPFEADRRIKIHISPPESPSFPCEHSVAAGVAVSVISAFYPALADSVRKLARQAMDSRVAAGVAFPSDTKAGFELGMRIAEEEIERTRDFVCKEAWDGKIPEGPQYWRGRFTLLPMSGKNKTAVLSGSGEFRPGPPPDYAKEMEELKHYKQNFRSLSNAFQWANADWFAEELKKKIFEYNLHLNPPLAAYIHAAMGVGLYDGFVACWDAKYTYWGIRPNQYDTTFRPAILVTPPFPGYPSGHAVITAVEAGLMSYFFPEEKARYGQKAAEAAESRFQAGIHFRSDNEAARELGKKVAEKLVQKLIREGHPGPMDKSSRQ